METYVGCDIHFYVERLVNGKWESADKWTPDQYAEADEKPLALDYDNSFYHDRNYDLFAILADVRNGQGFAGCDTGDGFVPISEQRGLPDDVTAIVKEQSDNYGCDGHSHSWLTVAELLAYDWTQETKHRGYVSAIEYSKWNQYRRERGECPEGYCGDVGGGAIRKVTETEMKVLLEPFGADRAMEPQIIAALHSVYCQVEWSQPYYKTARRFLSDCLPRLWRLGKPDDVRIVFWFDN